MKILFFTPHVALWVHTVPEAYLARGLAELGHEVSYLTCGAAQDYCACMRSVRLAPDCTPHERAPVCRACTQGAGVIARQYGFPMANMASLLTPQDQDALRKIAADAVAARSLDTEYLGVKVGRLALYEFTLVHKKMSMELTEPQWKEYDVYLANALVSLLAFSRHIEAERPELVVAFSPQYSNIDPATHYAMARGIRVLFFESGPNLSHRLGTMRVWDWAVHKLVNPALAYWGRSDDHPVSDVSAQAVTGHFRQLLAGHHHAVFSSPFQGSRSIRELWQIPQTSRILLMTLSSYDEAYAALLIEAFPEKKVFSDVFRTQAEWLKATLDWAREQPDVFVVVRIHPRDFPNKRGGSRSEQSWMLEGLLEGVPSNVHVNWPSENLSLYEIFEETDAIATGWSVTAMEGLILGIPVVTYDENVPSYPADIMRTGRSAEVFFRNLRAALDEGWSIANVRNGFRWLAYNFHDCTVSVSRTWGQREVPRTIADRVMLKARTLLPQIGKPLDLLGWKEAREAAQVLDRMIQTGADAIPAVPRQDHVPLDAVQEQHVIDAELRVLHGLLYDGKPVREGWAGGRPGLSGNIRGYLEARANP